MQKLRHNVERPIRFIYSDHQANWTFAITEISAGVTSRFLKFFSIKCGRNIIIAGDTDAVAGLDTMNLEMTASMGTN